MLYEYLWLKKVGIVNFWKKAMSGIIIGLIGVVLMMSSWELTPGIVFDTRSVILSISGLFFGPVPTVIAMLIAGTYRIMLGGEGVVMGLAVIISSGVIGIIWERLWSFIRVKRIWLYYLFLGIVNHAVMLACTLFLPSDLIVPTLAQISLPLLLIYPLANLFLGLFMNRQKENWNNRLALRKSEEKYSRLYENMNEALVVLDMNSCITEFNSAYREMLAYSEEELIGMRCSDLTPSKWLGMEQRIIDEEVMVYGNSSLYEKEYIRKDGSLVFVEIRIHLLRDGSGQPSGFWTMARDISTRKKALRQIEHERSQLKILIETVPDMIWLKSTKGVYLSCNRTFEKFNGFSENELIGKQDSDLYPQEVADFYAQKDLEVLKAEKTIRFSNWSVSALNGNSILTETIKTPMHDAEGVLIGVLGISRDITEIKRTEKELIKAKQKAEESDKLKSIFLANMSHEIRTPMNAIMGFTELLVDPEVEEDDKAQYINIIQNSGNRLLGIIDDIVDVSKLELNQAGVHKSETNLHAIFQSSIETVKKSVLFEEKPLIDLVLKLPEKNKDLTVLTDSNRVHQILDNLLKNAIKFSKQGIVEVGYKLANKYSGTVIEVYVQDEGCGIPENRMDIIFERFRQGDEENFIDGTGLGLTISKGLVSLLGGEIRCTSEEGKGSTFYFTIPYFESETKLMDDSNFASLEKSLDHKMILIVEDNYNSFLYLSKLLEDERAMVSHALNGNMMMKMLDDVDPDLVILDSKINGDISSRYLSDLKARNIKVIAHTAFDIKGQEDRYLASGWHGYISMPIGKAEFLKELRRVLN
ncbi:PAS domain S-box protein [Labilibaculum sp.]|uniref:PAS domain S-box protein n=1 Tax=Labilibaculum sp. TaxID=2060723 RepID=UPI0035666F5B